MNARFAGPGRSLRADARRNRDRILLAARMAFAAEGVTVPLDEIARRAGVGAGTVHRHFPTKEVLLEAIVVGSIEEFLEQARALDGDDAFFTFFARMVEHGADDRALSAALAHAGVDLHSLADQASAELLDALVVLLARAQRAGTVRRDVTGHQVKALLIGVFASSEWLDGDELDRRHLVEVVCDGLRADR